LQRQKKCRRKKATPDTGERNSQSDRTKGRQQHWDQLPDHQRKEIEGKEGRTYNGVNGKEGISTPGTRNEVVEIEKQLVREKDPRKTTKKRGSGAR